MHRPASSGFLPRIAAFALVLALAAGACSHEHSPKGDKGENGAKKKDDDPVPVDVMTLGNGPIESVLRFSVNLEAERQVQVLARAAGQVVKLRVEEGDKVKKGEVLLRLQDEEQKSQLAKAEHDLDKARRDLENQTKMHDRGLVSDQALEKATYDKKRLELLVADARRAVRYTVVRATIGGTVSKRLVKLGDFVRLQQPLFEVTDFDSIVARVFVPEKEMPALKVGMSARLRPQAGDAASVVKGRVDRIAPVIDPASGTVKVTIAIPRTGDLRPGMFVDVELVTGRKEQALRLPKRALVYDGEEPFAFKLVEADKVKKIRVEPEIEDRSFLEPKRGFAAGDKVVVAGQVGLKDGALVVAQPADRGEVEAAVGTPAGEADAAGTEKRVQ